MFAKPGGGRSRRSGGYAPARGGDQQRGPTVAETRRLGPLATVLPLTCRPGRGRAAGREGDSLV